MERLTHHAAIDGVAGFELLSTLIDLTRDAPPPEPPATPWVPDREPTELELMRARASAMLTQPLADMNLTELLDGPPVPVPEIPWPAPHIALGRFVARRLRIPVTDQTADLPAFDRSMFLLVKQLVYFNRYGKQHLADQPLLHDDDADAYRRALDLSS